MKRDESQPNFVIQALPATMPAEKATPTRSEVSPASKEEDWSPYKRYNGRATLSPPPTSRCTRSKAAPSWSRRESLVLVSEVAISDGDWQLRSISSFQRWKIISDGCAAAGAARSSAECRRKWEDLVAEFRRINCWEATARKNSSYWRISRDRRRKMKLPVEFDREVFDAMSAAMAAQEHELVAGDSDSEGLVDTQQEPLAIAAAAAEGFAAKDGDMGNLADAAEAAEELRMEVELDLGVKETSQSRRRQRIFKNPSSCLPGSDEVAQEMARKLKERAELVHAVLREGDQLKDEASRDRRVEEEEAGQRASRLMETLDGLTAALDRFAELIQGRRQP